MYSPSPRKRPITNSTIAYRGASSDSAREVALKQSRGLFRLVPAILLCGVPLATRALAESYYVAHDGSDAHAGTSQSAPLKTLQRAIDRVAPGDTVFLMNGIHRNTGEGSMAWVTKSGTPDRWITITALPGHKPKLRFDGWGALSFQSGSAFWEVSNIEIEGTNSEVTLDYALSVKDRADARANGNGIIVDGRRAGPKPHHFRFINNIVHDTGGCGICTVQADYVTIKGNTVYNTSWYTRYATSGISLYQNFNFDGTTSYRNFITNNRVYNNQTFVPWSATGRISDGNGIIIDDSKNTQNGSTLGPYQGRTLVANNIVFNNGGSGIHSYESERVDIVNNVAFQNSASPALDYPEIFASASHDVRILNNIIEPRTNGRVTSSSDSSAIKFDFNLFNGERGLPLNVLNNVSGAALFVAPSINPLVADFRLKPASPAIDRGTYEAAPATDFQGTPRPVGSAVDIGAYEGPGAGSGAAEPGISVGKWFRSAAGVTSGYVDRSGRTWVADVGYVGGETVSRGPIPISRTTNPQLYRNERYGMSKYGFRTGNGSYRVVLHFAETFERINASGQRVFDVNVEGKRTRDLDVFAAAGGRRNRAITRTYDVIVQDGELTIAFTAKQQKPFVNGIEILKRASRLRAQQRRATIRRIARRN
jgi:parallel beta-helix repeat protein